MKIGYFADGPWSHRTLEGLIENKDIEITFITPRYDKQDPVLKHWAHKLEIPFLVEKNVNDRKFIKNIEKFQNDILISMSFNQILKEEIINLPPKGFINCHAGALPFYRGRNPLNWALINGENEFGVTVHYVDTGIDTGDIIAQKLIPIRQTDNYGTLLSLAITECSDLLLETVKRISTGCVSRTKQDEIDPFGSYYCARLAGDELIDFNWSSQRCFNFVRALTEPGPGAHFNFDDVTYAIHKSELLENYKPHIGINGQIVGKKGTGYIVKVEDSVIWIDDIRNVSNPGCSVNSDFRIGCRLHGRKHSD